MHSIVNRMQERNVSKQPAKQTVADYHSPRGIVIYRASDGNEPGGSDQWGTIPSSGVYRGSVLCDLPMLKIVDQCHEETQSAGEVNHGP